MKNMNTQKFEDSYYFENLKQEILENGQDNYKYIEKQFHCKISFKKEKHNELQYTYYFTITSKLIKGALYIEMESGINNGSLINNYSFTENLTPSSRTIEIIKDVVLDEERVAKAGFSVAKARAVFGNYKKKILELDRQSNYDNYVTGGGTTKTNSYYKKEFDKIREFGLFWEYVYEEIEADINFV